MQKGPLLRRFLAGLVGLLITAPLALALLVALAFAGHTGPLARVLSGGDSLLELVDELRNPAEPDSGAPSDPNRLVITHGVASGDVTDRSAVIWARANGPATMHIAADAFGWLAIPEPSPIVVDATHDFTGHVVIRDLQPDTAYSYRVWFTRVSDSGGTISSDVEPGSFRTAPLADRPAAVTLLFGGDLGGGGNCRLADRGYPIFNAMAQLNPTLVLALGDMIYADNTCTRRGPNGVSYVPGSFRPVDHPTVDWREPAQTLPTYWGHWRYNRADLGLQRLLAAAPVFAMWDDHEIINDSGGSWATWRAGTEDRLGYPNLVAAARDSFFAYWPVARRTDDPNRLYRSFHWGQDVDLIMLDVRSYRSRNNEEDTPDHAKTMLGAEQLAWTKRELATSRATWKIVTTGVPLSAPTGGLAVPLFGRDGWASGAGPDAFARTGFERELLDLLGFLDDQRIENVVFLGADMHQALAIRYAIDLNGDGRTLRFHEFIAGPFSAVPRADVPALDPTLSPTLLYGEGGFFNFGYIRIERAPDGVPRLSFSVRDTEGTIRPASVLQLDPASATSPEQANERADAS